MNPLEIRVMRKLLILFKINILLFFFFTIFSSAWAIKPHPPVELFFRQANPGEGTSQVTLIATADLDVSRIELSIELSPGLTLIKGEEKWDGPLRKGETKTMEVVVQNPSDVLHKIAGIAIIYLKEGGAFVERSAVILNGKKDESPLRGPSLKRKNQGETILEFKEK